MWKCMGIYIEPMVLQTPLQNCGYSVVHVLARWGLLRCGLLECGGRCGAGAVDLPVRLCPGALPVLYVDAVVCA